jgi:hypothetical protein
MQPRKLSSLRARQGKWDFFGMRRLLGDERQTDYVEKDSGKIQTASQSSPASELAGRDGYRT